ncbi:16S rRNA (guanine(966)-N(2))-methyltransferase RsmD [Humisphaera borealis]|uniref:16S rRNA (Guanine(966)-N(2))-methyltransferase RsmD n=1 Tax=Humisphaera borealis TaxID=2807512 RepID=A0A7M2WY81_9BACT|nr:16S rRNA (guanine(966)-N(2))-methyltransferase RsmD [Humisphaera borealis]
MRIIAGEYRGRKLLPPETDATRPVTDRVKQSLFDILAPVLPEARVYDCFAGTGSMGLESLSRGSTHATFFETDRSAAARLRRNIETLAVAKLSTVVTLDIFRWFATTPSLPDERRIDVIFLDPPYRFLRERPDDLRTLAAAMAAYHLKADGVIVFRHDAADQLELPGLRIADERLYGGMALKFLRVVRSDMAPQIAPEPPEPSL